MRIDWIIMALAIATVWSGAIGLAANGRRPASSSSLSWLYLVLGLSTGMAFSPVVLDLKVSWQAIVLVSLAVPVVAACLGRFIVDNWRDAVGGAIIAFGALWVGFIVSIMVEIIMPAELLAVVCSVIGLVAIIAATTPRFGTQ